MTRTKRLVLAAALGLAGAALARSMIRPVAQAAPWPTAPTRSRSAIVDGIPMRWEEHGDGGAGTLPVVLVHGLPTNPRAWRHVLPFLEGEGVRCLAWEQVGFGHSLVEGLGRDLSIPAQAGRLSAWLRHLGIDRAVFVAHDYGGGVVQQLATREPERFLGLVLADSVAFDNWPVAAVRAAQALAPVIERLPPALTRPLFRAALANLGHRNPAIAAESSRLFWEPYDRPIGPRALAHQLRYFRSEDTMAVGRRLRPLGVPTIVIWGERDPLGVPSARELAAALAADLRIIPGAYHFTPEDNPDRIAAAALEVVRAARTRADSPGGGP